MSARLRVLELYAGIGGLAAALEPAAEVARIVAAVDVDRSALAVYSRNFPHPAVAATLESIPAERWRSWRADLWWLSPPCQPFTRRGLGRDLDDPRTRSFLAVVERLAELRPRYVALENVPPFRGSRTHGRLLATLDEAGYTSLRQTVLCPTELGIPNRRRRFYLVAARGELAPSRAAPPGGRPLTRPLRSFLDRRPEDGLEVDREILAQYRQAIDVVDAGDPGAVTSCFTSAYGRSPVRSGSYLASPGGGVRRFSPAEVLRFLGFQDGFDLAGASRRSAWRLAGNSLSLPAVRAVLRAVPELDAVLA